MYKSILAILLVGLLAAPALAVPPPGGWGNHCESWQECEGDFAEFALHNDDPPQGCCDVDGWTVFIGMDPQDYPFMAVGSLQLWIELYACHTVFNTHWQFHRLATAGFTIEFMICGIIRSNNGIVVQITGNQMPMGAIQYIHNVFGRDDGLGYDYAISWRKAFGAGDNIPVEKQWIDATGEVSGTGMITFVFEEPCDHWWCIYGVFCVEYHAHDGYYLLSLIACPLPIL
jgi:hypothetical protein